MLNEIPLVRPCMTLPTALAEMSPMDKRNMQQRGSKPEDTQRKVRRRVSINDLLQDADEVIIEHGQEEYRLRLTSNSKLILTK